MRWSCGKFGSWICAQYNLDGEFVPHRGEENEQPWAEFHQRANMGQLGMMLNDPALVRASVGRGSLGFDPHQNQQNSQYYDQRGHQNLNSREASLL